MSLNHCSGSLVTAKKKKKKKKKNGAVQLNLFPTAAVRAPRAWGVYKPLLWGPCLQHEEKKKKKKRDCAVKLVPHSGCESAQSVGCL